MGRSHEIGRNGACIDCMKAESAPKRSICWACGHIVDHELGHDCFYGDDDF